MFVKRSPSGKIDLSVTLINNKPYLILYPRKLSLVLPVKPASGRISVSAQEDKGFCEPAEDIDPQDIDAYTKRLKQMHKLVVGLLVMAAFRKLDNKLYQKARNLKLKD